MIRIDVEGYCQACLDFEPDVVKPVRNLDTNTWSDTVVQCKYRKRCAGIRRYLEQNMREETEAVG